MYSINRKQFLNTLSLLAGSTLIPAAAWAVGDRKYVSKMKLGLVTYQWGKDWDVPTLIKNCTATGIHGVELRVDHAHHVTPEMSKQERLGVKKQFADSPVVVVGMGTNEQYDFPDQDRLKAAIARTKEFIQLSADIGGSGVKVKPNAFHENVPREQTMAQIGASLKELAAYAADFGQQLRLEVHGNETQNLPNIKTIMDHADHPNATICWNCNPQDLDGQGFQYNFDLVKDRLGDTIHVRELDRTDYPYPTLLKNLSQLDYSGWILLECHTNPEDKVGSMRAQRAVFDRMVSKL
ncbi:sugar phosphate isomerase/epimerase family protein [Parapedobacter indicus]|uniref:Sugar phosphate isomerase/epimerase n=1 Tax=Parapedobacter indicus TaxID=1477437 RepID=A0A1I3QNJ2_9SPHI|nr:TIM barrel protein [Parapedobacter indicus]PPL00188.1 sugar phosphate isomerase/epimerase [Parapedobacter indicus]SFJ35663.1 Sugar phosphate isomerase/epimerase [Parapedobacter indicus]